MSGGGFSRILAHVASVRNQVGVRYRVGEGRRQAAGGGAWRKRGRSRTETPLLGRFGAEASAPSSPRAQHCGVLGFPAIAGGWHGGRRHGQPEWTPSRTHTARHRRQCRETTDVSTGGRRTVHKLVRDRLDGVHCHAAPKGSGRPDVRQPCRKHGRLLRGRPGLPVYAGLPADESETVVFKEPVREEFKQQVMTARALLARCDGTAASLFQALIPH